MRRETRRWGGTTGAFNQNLIAHGHTVAVDGVRAPQAGSEQGGWPLDYAREAAEEADYLRGNHNGTSTDNDLLDAIDAEMRGQKRYPDGFEGHVCQSAFKFDPGSASNFDPFERRVLAVALAPSELVGVAETVRARAA